MFKQAMDKHLSLMRQCMNGEGIDRHLLGLKILAAENGMTTPQLFNDAAYEKRYAIQFELKVIHS